MRAGCGIVLIARCTQLAGAGDLADATARAEFGFYAAEPGTIESAIASLQRMDSQDGEEMRLAELGYARWKLAQLAAAQDPQAASGVAVSCVETLDDAIELARGLPEAHAVQSACYGLLVELGGMLKAPWYGRRSGKGIEAALALAPDNPRVRLIDGLNDYQLPQALGGDKERAYRKFRDAVAAFEAASPAFGDDPDWGHAEALAWLGKTSLEHGDVVAARESLERALIIAPGYAWARSLLEEVTRVP